MPSNIHFSKIKFCNRKFLLRHNTLKTPFLQNWTFATGNYSFETIHWKLFFSQIDFLLPEIPSFRQYTKNSFSPNLAFATGNSFFETIPQKILFSKNGFLHQEILPLRQYIKNFFSPKLDFCNRKFYLWHNTLKTPLLQNCIFATGNSSFETIH